MVNIEFSYLSVNHFAIDYHIILTLLNQKLICYNVDSSTCPPIYLT